MRYKIALDCDDVLNNLNDVVCKVFNKENNANLTEESFTYYDIYKCLPFEDASKYAQLWYREDIWNSLTPIENSQWGVKKLIDNGYEVYITTASNTKTLNCKINWLKKFFPFIDEKHIICIKDKSLLNVDVMIDDNADNLINNIHCNRVLFDKCWNKSVHDDVYGMKRCMNWDEVVKAVNEFYKYDEELMSN